MPELALQEAAHTLGLSVDALRRRIKAGKVDAHQDERGRWRVLVDAYATPMQSPAIATQALADAQSRIAELVAERDELSERLDDASEVYTQRTRALEGELVDVRGQLIRAETERDAAIAERDRLWGMLSGTLGRLLPAAGETIATPTPERRWWQVWR